MVSPCIHEYLVKSLTTVSYSPTSKRYVVGFSVKIISDLSESSFITSLRMDRATVLVFDRLK